LGRRRRRSVYLLGDTLLDEILPYECLGGYTPYHAGSFMPHFFD